jgi:hypothetical protein
MTINDFAKEIPLGKWIYLEKTEETENFIKKKTDDIFNNPVTRHGREYEEVYNSTKKMLIEYALAKYDANFILNTKEHNKFDPDTYAYDLTHAPSGITIEIKRFGESDNFKWFSYPKKALNTFLKNLDIIDVLICGKLKENKANNSYEVKFMLVADAKSFKKYMKTSVYKSEDIIYSHYNAAKNGDCVFNI